MQGSIDLLPPHMPHQDLRTALRHATSSSHARVERLFAAAGHLEDDARYCDLLRRLWALHANVERQLARLEWRGVVPDIDRRLVKADWLAEDLAVLGQDVAGWPVPLVRILPADASPADGLGCLYVVEGATLGGTLLAREVATRLGRGAGSGARFLDGYGADRGRMWRTFTAALARYPASPRERRRAIEAAIVTFDIFALALRPNPAIPA